MGILRFTLGLILLLITVMYSVQNLESVPIGYYNRLFELETIHVPVVVIIFSSILFGYILSWVANIPKIFGLKSVTRKQRKEIRKLIKLSERKDTRIVSLTEVAKSKP